MSSTFLPWWLQHLPHRLVPGIPLTYMRALPLQQFPLSCIISCCLSTGLPCHPTNILYRSLLNIMSSVPFDKKDSSKKSQPTYWSHLLFSHTLINLLISGFVLDIPLKLLLPTAPVTPKWPSLWCQGSLCPVLSAGALLIFLISLHTCPIVEPLPSVSADNLYMISFILLALKTNYMRKVPIFMSPGLTSCLKTRYLYPLSYLISPLGDLIGISNLTPPKPNSFFMPFPPNQIYFTPSSPFAIHGNAVLSLVSYSSQDSWNHLRPLSGKPHIQLIGQCHCLCFQTTSRIQLPFFFAAFVTTLLVKVIITGLHLSILAFSQFILNAEARLSL